MEIKTLPLLPFFKFTHIFYFCCYHPQVPFLPNQSFSIPVCNMLVLSLNRAISVQEKESAI